MVGARTKKKTPTLFKSKSKVAHYDGDDDDTYVIHTAKSSKSDDKKKKKKVKAKVGKNEGREAETRASPPRHQMVSEPPEMLTMSASSSVGPRIRKRCLQCPWVRCGGDGSAPVVAPDNYCVKLAQKAPETPWSRVVPREDPVNHAVQFMFYRPSLMNSATMYVYAVNWLVAWCTSNGDSSLDFCHVEICFPNGICSSVVGGLTVHFGERSWTKENNQSMCGLTVQLPGPEQVERMYTWCRNQALAAIPFNKYGTWWNFVVPCSGHVCPYRAQGRAFFCSEFSLTALQHVGISLTDGISEDLDPATVSPTDLYQILEKQGLMSGGTVKVFHDRNVSFVCRLLDATAFSEQQSSKRPQ